ncbi:MAG: serine protein kinase RIO [Candidatus Thermoplasmatota archaeon]|nr:serine protein kinase RIO [Candidatus Thermoplasmatota archaeon]
MVGEDNLSALQYLIQSGEFRNSHDMDRKTESRVFDKRTLMSLYQVMKDVPVKSVDFPIASGKESLVFRATGPRGNLAIKIYKISTLRFNRIDEYINGDPRFAKERKTRNSIVYLWARKEMTNLSDMQAAGIRVPRPVALRGNVLVMQYIGNNASPAPLLKDSTLDPEAALDQIRNILRTMYRNAGIVHCDFSEYNLLVHRKKIYVIDVGQSVSIKHPMAMDFLHRDIKNITAFLMRKDVKIREDELFHYVIGDE